MTTAGASPAMRLDAAGLRAALDSVPAHAALLDCRRRHRFVNWEYAAFFDKPAGRSWAER